MGLAWTAVDHKLVASHTFQDFKVAWAFLSQVALITEKMDHHAEIYNCYNQVELKLSTHSSGCVTDLDRELARKIDGILI